MLLPPIVEREMLARSRRWGFFWLRGLLAVVAGVQCYGALNQGLMLLPAGAAPGGSMIGGAFLLRQVTGLQFVAALLMGLLGADALNRERREGTLGLLLLTNLTPSQIVYGKALSCGLTAFFVLLGALPAVMVPVLAGGVRGFEATVTGLGLLNVVFVALAGGLWMSALFRERRYSVAATLTLVAFLAFAPDILGGGMFGPAAASILRLFGLSGWMTVAHARIGAGSLALFVLWFVLMQAMGWGFLRLAARTLSSAWQTDAWSRQREPEPSPARELVSDSFASACPPAFSPRSVSWWSQARPWEKNPVRWRMEQAGEPGGLLWLGIAMNFFAQFGVMGTAFNDNPASAGTWGLLSFTGLLVMLVSSGLQACAGAKFFQHANHHGDLELLLTTPAGCQGILSGQWQVLRRKLKWPLGAVLAVAVPAGASLVVDYLSGSTEDFWYLLPPFLIALNIAVEAVALCWVGMRFGLHAPSMFTAAARTVALVELMPLGLAVAGMWTWGSINGFPGASPAASWRMPAVVPPLLFLLVKNLALGLWAPFSLRRELRIESPIAARKKRVQIQHSSPGPGGLFSSIPPG